jgi:hypothetical protein
MKRCSQQKMRDPSWNWKKKKPSQTMPQNDAKRSARERTRNEKKK